MPKVSWLTFLIRLPLVILVGFIVVPQHLLLLYYLLLRASFAYFGNTTYIGVGCYCCWMMLTNHLKFKAGHIGPDNAARFVQWAFRLYLDSLGCECEVINEFVPDSDNPLKAVCCYNPHGSFATGGICYAMAEFRLHPVISKLDGNLMAASVIFYVPILREILLLLGCRDAGKKTIEALLDANRSIGCSPGGVWEQLHTDSDREQCFVMSKAGFLRLAMKHGRPIVPIYAFGENQLYTTYDINYPLRKYLARKMYLGVSIATGRLGLPFPLIPHPTKITIVSGKAVNLGPPNANPTAKELAIAFEKYSAELHRLFEKYKDMALPAKVAANGFKVRWRSIED